MSSARAEDQQPRLHNRRRAFGAGAGALVAAGLLQACDTGSDPKPDPLTALADAAGRDAATAHAVAAAYPDLNAAGAVAKARRAQETELRREINRAAAETPSREPSKSKARTPPGGQDGAVRAMTKALRAAQDAAAELIGTVPEHRAGLVGSVAAGCGALQELFR